MTKKTLAQKKIEATKPSLWNRIFRFFFPKDFKGEFRRGMQAGEGKVMKARDKRRKK